MLGFWGVSKMKNSSRVHYLDNLRSIAVIGIVPYHIFRVFDWGPYYIKLDSLTSIEVVSRFLLTWYMPLFFLIAGASAVYSLGKRSPGAFFKERIMRLMIPFCLGIAFLMPINGYLTYQHKTGMELTFLQYLPLFLELKSLTGYEGQFSFGHYWFLGYLAGFCLVAPWLLKRTASLQTPIQAVPFVLAAGLLLIATRLTLMPYPNPFNFVVYFAIGVVMFTQPGLADAVLRYKRNYLVCALATAAMFQYVRLTVGPSSFDGIYWFEALRAINAWLWVLTLMSYGSALLNFSGPGWSWVSRHGLWIYFFHLPIVTIFAYFLGPMISNPYVLMVAILFFSFVFTLPLAMVGLAVENYFAGRERVPSIQSGRTHAS